MLKLVTVPVIDLSPSIEEITTIPSPVTRFEDKVEEMKKRFENYEKIVREEFK